MEFLYKPKVDKKLILSRFSEEQIMEYYLHVPVKKGLFKNPLRNDMHVTCSFFRSKSGTLMFKDFATGQCFTCFDVVRNLFNCNYFDALLIIANDFGIIHYDALQKNPGKINLNFEKLESKESSKIEVEIQDFTELELKWWGKYGITLDILKKFNVYSCKHVFLNDELFAESKQNFPIFGYYGGTIKEDNKKHELWRIYIPKRTSFRFITNWKSKKIQGFDQLPKSGKLLVITKSMKDCLCLYQFNITAIAPCSENLFVSESVLEDLKNRFQKIVVFYDNDRPGMYNMAKIRRQHPELIYTYIPKMYQSKDISDFYKDHGKAATIKLLKEFALWIK